MRNDTFRIIRQTTMFIILGIAMTIIGNIICHGEDLLTKELDFWIGMEVFYSALLIYAAYKVFRRDKNNILQKNKVIKGIIYSLPPIIFILTIFAWYKDINNFTEELGMILASFSLFVGYIIAITSNIIKSKVIEAAKENEESNEVK